ncbi:hypothetical protein M408DRAFT_62927, partial [Serendipita vermifera MAFF 305830]
LTAFTVDGGGVRSFSQLEILRVIMHQIKWDKYPNDPDKVVLPCDYFDLMGGSDTGGLIAIMLSRLRMPVEEALDEFALICEKVYQVQDLEPAERTQRLRDCMEDMLKRNGLPLDLKLVEKSGEGRCVWYGVQSRELRSCLRSYQIRSQPISPITVVEAVLATCATQPTFSPAVIGTGYRKQEYLGATHGASSPIRDVITEAHTLLGGDSKVASLLSVGSGNPGTLFFSSDGSYTDYHRVTLDMLKNCEQTAQEIQQQYGRIGIYTRLSVEQGMQDEHHTQFSDLGWIIAQTEGYLSESTTSEKLNACAKSTDARVGIIALDQLSEWHYLL